MRNPLISVVVPVHNGQTHIIETLQSIQRQSFGDFECLVCDDGSTDDTLEIAADFARSDRRFQVHRQAENKGVAYARNRGVASCRGQFVAICDSDDYWYPGKLQNQLGTLTASGRDLVFSLCEVKNAEGRTRRMLPGALTEEMFASPPSAFVRVLRFNPAVCGSNIMWRKEKISPYKQFSERLCPGDDWDFLLWVARYGTVLLCPHYDVRYQRRQGSITGVHPHLPSLYFDVFQSWVTKASPSEWTEWRRLQDWAEGLQRSLYPPTRIMTSPYDTNWEEMAEYQRLQSELEERYQQDALKAIKKAKQSHAK